MKLVIGLIASLLLVAPALANGRGAPSRPSQERSTTERSNHAEHRGARPEGNGQPTKPTEKGEFKHTPLCKKGDCGGAT